MTRRTQDDAVQSRDRRWMARALRLGAQGRPSPNPHVGAVVVSRDGRWVADGFHARAGAAHAEVAALTAAGDAARGATLYVTFEPCNHFGRTPPCTDAILAAGVARVVVGCRDTAPHVPGALEKLRAAGVSVTVGVREGEALSLVADFTKHIRTGVPFVTLKAAVSLDGRIGTRDGDSRWITGERARAEAHRLRDRSDAVLVGVSTVLADDPELTVRHVAGRTPLRAVLDSTLRTPPDARLLATSSREAPVLLFHGPDAPEDRREALRRAGAELVPVPGRSGRREEVVKAGGVTLQPVLEELGRREVVRLLVEGGGRVHGSFLREGLADRVAWFIAPVLFGDPAARAAVAGGPLASMDDVIRLRPTRVRRLGPDVLVMADLPGALGADPERP
jgi:diaminohydroxyphosphoribosylaminopyrimidine deaminase/5-amino-6-(5-phosphoribosylamino)uracil reductase